MRYKVFDWILIRDQAVKDDESVIFETAPLAVPDSFVGDGAPSSSVDRGVINHFTSSAPGGVK